MLFLPREPVFFLMPVDSTVDAAVDADLLIGCVLLHFFALPNKSLFTQYGLRRLG